MLSFFATHGNYYISWLSQTKIGLSYFDIPSMDSGEEEPWLIEFEPLAARLTEELLEFLLRGGS